MSFLDNFLDGVKAVAPDLVSFIPGIGPVASAGLRAMMKTVTKGQDDPEVAAEIIMQDPELIAKIRVQAMQTQIELERERTKQLETVNQSMQAESRSESKAQRGWRPFNGFMFGITLFMDYVGSQFILLAIQVLFEDPGSFTFEHVPASVYCLWTGVLGVSAGSRGFEKVSKNKQPPGIGNVVKTFIQGALGR